MAPGLPERGMAIIRLRRHQVRLAFLKGPVRRRYFNRPVMHDQLHGRGHKMLLDCRARRRELGSRSI